MLCLWQVNFFFFFFFFGISVSSCPSATRVIAERERSLGTTNRKSIVVCRQCERRWWVCRRNNPRFMRTSGSVVCLSVCRTSGGCHVTGVWNNQTSDWRHVTSISTNQGSPWGAGAAFWIWSETSTKDWPHSRGISHLISSHLTRPYLGLTSLYPPSERSETAGGDHVFIAFPSVRLWADYK